MKPQDTLKHHITGAMDCRHNRKLLKALGEPFATIRHSRNVGYCKACGMLKSQCACWDSVNGD